MKKLFLISILLFFLIGCIEQVSEEQAKKTLENTVSLEIPLDLPGKVSFTKNFYFVFDGSGSMSGEKLSIAKRAIEKFVSVLPSDINLGLYVFDSYYEEEKVSLELNNKEKFLKAVNEVSAGGVTPLYDAMIQGTNSLVTQYKKQYGYGEYRLIIVTDGEADNLEEASVYAMQYGMPIYTIGFQISGNHPLMMYSAEYRSAENEEELVQALVKTTAEAESFDDINFDQL